MLNEAQIAEIRKRFGECPGIDTCHNNLDDLLSDRDELARRLGQLEAAAREFLAADSWCAGATDHDLSVTACPCGYAQLRTAFGPAAPVAAAPVEEAR